MSNVLEDYRKIVNSIYLSTWAIGQGWFAASDSGILLTIANGDPVEWGEAVYSARVMLGLDVDNTGNRLNGELPDKTSADNSNMRIIPNPARNSAELLMEVKYGETASLDVYSITGERIQSNRLFEGSTHHLDLSNISPGLYLLRLLVNGEYVYSERIIVMK